MQAETMTGKTLGDSAADKNEDAGRDSAGRTAGRERIGQFLEDVDAQIACRLSHAAVNEELRAHIEDKAEVYLEYGLEEEEAYIRAIRDMGDADVIGIAMNRQHRLRTAKPLLLVVIALMIAGIAGNLVLAGGIRDFRDAAWAVQDNFYYIWGGAVLAVTIKYGFWFLLKHAKKAVALFLTLCILVAAFHYSMRLFPYLGELSFERMQLIRKLLYAFLGSTAYWGLMQLAAPVGAVLLYRRRNRPRQVLLLFGMFQVLGIVLADICHSWSLGYIPVLIFLLTCFGTVLYLAGKGWMSLERKKGMAAAAAGFAVLLLFWAAPKWGKLQEEWSVCIDPGSRASVTSAWDDSYNNVLIRELLGRAALVGEVPLTEEERLRYGTSQWYYEDEEGTWSRSLNPKMAQEDFEEHVEYRLQYLDIDGGPALSDILPDKTQANYRIDWWVLRYGLLPAFVLILLTAALPAAAFSAVFRIRSRLGRLTAFAGSLALTLQTLFYYLGNLGFQFGSFSNLPFVAEGKISLTGSAVLAGLILSAYRFDTVLEEKE